MIKKRSVIIIYIVLLAIIEVLVILISLEVFRQTRTQVAPSPHQNTLTRITPQLLEQLKPGSTASPFPIENSATSSLILTSTTMPSPIPGIDPLIYTKLGAIESNVTYCLMGTKELKMDIYYPYFVTGAWPVVVNIHPGRWVAGNKETGETMTDLTLIRQSGFLVVSIEYRLGPDYKFPAMIEDVKCAVRFLRENSLKYNLNKEKVGVLGSSSGGHLAALLGTAENNENGWDNAGQYLQQSSRVQAVVDFYGPSDLTAPDFLSDPGNQVPWVFGTNDRNAAIFLEASPVKYISPDDPPFLIIHGRLDALVPFSQSQVLFDRLQIAGVPATLIAVENGDHGFKQVGDQPISPTRAEITQMVVDFFIRYLK